MLTLFVITRGQISRSKENQSSLQFTGLAVHCEYFLDPETGLQAPPTLFLLSLLLFFVMKLFTHARINDNILHQATVAEF